MNGVLRCLSVRGALSVFLALAAPTVLAQATYQFDLPAQPLADSLRAVGRQTGTNILFEPDIVRGISAAALRAQLTTSEALGRLLAGHELSIRHTAADTVVVQRVTQDTSSAPDQGSTSSAPTSIGGTDGDTHLAQSESATRSVSAVPAQERSTIPTAETERVDLGEVVVTGTHIRGVESAGSNVIILSRDDIDSSGYATVQDVLRTLPQNFGGGISEDFSTDASAQNLNFGTAVNLRGLGGDSTLVLVNGRRQPNGGLNGAFVDISSIAVSAVERIEVLTDGASAIYGSDAVGGVVNIVLRSDFKGAETRLRYGTLDGDADETQISQLLGTKWAEGESAEGNVLVGYQYYERKVLGRAERAYTASDDLTRFGGSDFRSFNSNPGNILDPSTFAPAFAIPAGQDGTSLTPGDLLPGVVNFHESSEQGDLLPEQETQSAFLTASQGVGEGVELFMDARYGTRDTRQSISGASSLLDVPASNAFFVDPFGGSPSVLVTYNFLDDLGPITGTSTTDTLAGALGARVDLGQTWQTTVAGSYGDEDIHFRNVNLVDFGLLFGALASPDASVAFNPFGDGSHTNPATVEAIRGSQDNRAESRVWAAHATADGPLVDLPGGALRVAVGGRPAQRHSYSYATESTTGRGTPAGGQ